MTDVYLGVHRGRWLEQLRVPMCVSLNILHTYASDWERHPKAFTPWVLDSGAYNEISRFGRWRVDPDLFGSRVTRVLHNVGTPPIFCSPQDMPCEPWSLKASRLTVGMHQYYTTENLLYLRDNFPFIPWIPVLQGWELAHYIEHVVQYRKAGIDLTREPLVGVGSLCRRQRGDTATVVRIIRQLRDIGISIHGFGVSLDVLARRPTDMSSMDSMAWSRTGRWSNRPLPGCTHSGPCNNCRDAAFRWYRRAVELTGEPALRR
ncbi:hypothetical protein L3Q67_01705 [Saccharothrix sp. AJ9571]|nr:hypothetical protein L3Q67_01705 [Saccharothrix sp. AJ9571]